MSAFSPSLRFLHSLRQLEHLQQALSLGVMFTSHKVLFRPAESHDHWYAVISSVMPLLFCKLRQLGLPWESLSEERRQVLMSGLGTVSANVPMICFTEVPDGRGIALHQYQFGRYGLVVRREWLDQNNADRVLYIGDNSAVSRRVFHLVAKANIQGLHIGANDEPLFDNSTTSAVVDLIAYVETRQNLEELEWRIAGRHGLMGGPNDKDSRLPLPIDSVETIFVEDETEIDGTIALVESLALAQSASHRPEILCSSRKRRADELSS